MRILKWEIGSIGRIERIGCGPVVLVGTQDVNPGKICVWTAESEASGVVGTRPVMVVGTGTYFPPDWEWLGSTQSGVFVWHVLGCQEVES